jgi:hypothetical protein
MSTKRMTRMVVTGGMVHFSHKKSNRPIDPRGGIPYL